MGRATPGTCAEPTLLPGSAMAGTAQGTASPHQRFLGLLTTQEMVPWSPRKEPRCLQGMIVMSPALTAPTWARNLSQPVCAQTPAEQDARCGVPGLGAGSELRVGHSAQTFTPEPLKDIPRPCQVQAAGARGSRAHSSRGELDRDTSPWGDGGFTSSKAQVSLAPLPGPSSDCRVSCPSPA